MTNILQLDLHLKRVNTLYSLYQKHPNYRHALTLKRANQDIIELIPLVYANQYSLVLNDMLKQLLIHLDFWFVQFNEHALDVLNHDQLFQFQREAHFPTFPTGLPLEIQKILNTKTV